MEPGPGIAECLISEQSHSHITEITKHISCVGLTDNPQVETESTTAISPKTSDYEVKSSRWLKVRDSLEGISPQCRENLLFDAPQHGEKYIKSKSPLSDSVLVFKKPSSHINFSKIFMWDPWNKIGRKNKKEKLRQQNEERAMKLEHRNRGEGPSPILRKPSGTDKHVDGIVHVNSVEQDLTLPSEHNFAEKFHKSVRFQKDVNVVYFAGDQILEQKTEPLKKETEQQERNKELRREVNAETVSGIKFVLRKSQSDYSRVWNKK